MSRFKRESGFTIVELMIATVIFSMIMLICAAAITYIGRMYYKGQLTNRTQEASRAVMQELVAAVQYGGGSSIDIVRPRPAVSATYSGIEVRAVCVGETRFNWTPGASQGTGSGQSRHVVWRDTVGPSQACTTQNIVSATPSAGISLLGDRMRLPVLDVQLPTNSLYPINIVVSYGEDGTTTGSSLFESGSNFTLCKGVAVGGDFCAVSSLSTNVLRRLQ